MSADEEQPPNFELRSAALDAWSWHLLGCATCARSHDLCDVAAELVSRLGDQLAC